MLPEVNKWLCYCIFSSLFSENKGCQLLHAGFGGYQLIYKMQGRQLEVAVNPLFILTNYPRIETVVFLICYDFPLIFLARVLVSSLSWTLCAGYVFYTFCFSIYNNGDNGIFPKQNWVSSISGNKRTWKRVETYKKSTELFYSLNLSHLVYCLCPAMVLVIFIFSIIL